MSSIKVALKTFSRAAVVVGEYFILFIGVADGSNGNVIFNAFQTNFSLNILHFYICFSPLGVGKIPGNL